MRLFLIGESRFGALFFRAATAAGHELVGVSVTGRGFGEPDPLASAAEAAGVPVWPPAPIADGWVRPLRQSGAELLVLANVSVILPREVIAACPRGALCFHPSLLPKYRGKRAVRDALAAGDTYTGVSIFSPDDGADTGPVVLQARCEIAQGETAAALYHDKLVPVGVYCLLAALAAEAARCAPRIPQSPAREPPP